MANTTYSQSVARARNQFRQVEEKTVTRIKTLYQDTAAGLKRDIEKLPRGSLQRGSLEALQSRLEERIRVLNDQTLKAIQQGISLSVDTAMAPAQELAQKYLKPGLPSLDVNRAFRAINERAVLALIARTNNPDGLVLSTRVWEVGQALRGQLQNSLANAVISGMDSRVLARKVQWALKPGASLVSAQSRKELGLSKDVAYPAMRLARTEINNAFHEGTILANRSNPAYKGVYWRLSNNHPVEDICNEYARHGPKGDGFFEKGSEPQKPHPQCRCFLVPVYEDPKEFADRLTRWTEDPKSQPDLEGWYRDFQDLLPVERRS